MSRTDACILPRSIRTLWFTLALCFPMIAASQTVEFFIQADFAAEVGSRNVIGFDIPNQADGALAGEEYLGCGLTIIQIDGNDINIVGNLAPGSFGGNYVTEANIDSAPNAISSSTNVGGARIPVTRQLRLGYPPIRGWVIGPIQLQQDPEPGRSSAPDVSPVTPPATTSLGTSSERDDVFLRPGHDSDSSRSSIDRDQPTSNTHSLRCDTPLGRPSAYRNALSPEEMKSPHQGPDRRRMRRRTLESPRTRQQDSRGCSNEIPDISSTSLWSLTRSTAWSHDFRRTWLGSANPSPT